MVHTKARSVASGLVSFVTLAKAGVRMSHQLVRLPLHANVDPWMPDQVGHDGLEMDRAWRSRKPAVTR
jgi:hypothetical protein